MSFIKDVWGGHDYIPYVWDDWLKDANNRMFVVLLDGVPVGMNRVSFLRDGSAWFQGVRVHPEHRGKGLATMLGENSMRVAKKKGARTFRLTTESRNFASRRQTARIGFKEVARFSVYALPRGPSTSLEVPSLVKSDEAATALRLVRASSEFSLGAGLYWHNFTTVSLTGKVFKGLVNEGRVWRLGRSIAIASMGDEGSEKWGEVGFVGGPAQEAGVLAVCLLGRLRAADRWVFVPQGSRIVSALRSQGLERQFSQIVFERRAANG